MLGQGNGCQKVRCETHEVLKQGGGGGWGAPIKTPSLLLGAPESGHRRYNGYGLRPQSFLGKKGTNATPDPSNSSPNLHQTIDGVEMGEKESPKLSYKTRLLVIPVRDTWGRDTARDTTVLSLAVKVKEKDTQVRIVDRHCHRQGKKKRGNCPARYRDSLSRGVEV